MTRNGTNMTVRDRIQLLEKYPPDTHAMVNGYETSFDDISVERVSIVKVNLNSAHSNPKSRSTNPQMPYSAQSPKINSNP